MAARQTLGGIRRDLIRSAFCDYFGIGEARSNLLIALYERQGVPAKAPELGRAVDSHRRPTEGAVQESIRLLRASMEPEAIDRTDAGYFLSDVGLAECRQALSAVAVILSELSEGRAA